MLYRSADPKIKVLFVGLGSIGQRHVQNFKALAPFEATLLAYRTSGFNHIIRDGVAISCESLADYYDLIEYRELDQALEQGPDIGFICNPSNKHIETAIKLAEKGCHLFIEKPLDTDITDLPLLEDLVKKNRLIAMVGYQSRFHPALQETKSIIDSKCYGEVVSARFLWHNYLPHYHRYEDYRRSYAARSDLGGGVTFNLIHEMDLIQWLLTMPLEVYAVEGVGSRLEGDVEDTMSALFKCAGEQSTYPVSLSLSYAQGLEQRSFNVLMQDAVLMLDLERNNLQVTTHQREEVVTKDYSGVTRNDLFRAEIKHFLEAVTGKQETDIPLEEGKKSLAMSLAVHRSLKSGKVVEIQL